MIGFQSFASHALGSTLDFELLVNWIVESYIGENVSYAQVLGIIAIFQERKRI